MGFGWKKRPSGRSGKRKPVPPEVVAERKALRKAATAAKHAAKKAEAEAAKTSTAWWCSKLKAPHDDACKARAMTDDHVKRFAVREGSHVATKVFFQFDDKVAIKWLQQNWRFGACEWEIGKMLDWEKMLKNDTKYSGWDVKRDEVVIKTTARQLSGEDISENPLAALINVAVQRRRSAAPRKKTTKRRTTTRRIDGSASGSTRYTLQYNNDGTVKSMKTGSKQGQRKAKPAAAAAAEDGGGSSSGAGEEDGSSIWPPPMEDAV